MRCIVWLVIIIFYGTHEATCDREKQSPMIVQPVSYLRKRKSDSRPNNQNSHSDRSNALEKAKNCGQKLFGQAAEEAARKKSVKVDNGGDLAVLLIDRDNLNIPIEIVHSQCKSSCRKQLLLESVSRCEYSSTHEACYHGCDEVLKWVRHGDRVNLEMKGWGQCDCKKVNAKLVCLDPRDSSGFITPTVTFLMLAVLVAV
eukprot:Platyproteum_vivax@DN540_c0_g1_i1.p1